MGVLQLLERRLEELVSGAFTRVFKGKVEPVEVAAQLQRETDDNRTVVGEGRILVPNDFVVELGTTDYERLAPYAKPLGAELSDMVSEHAAEEGYSFVGPVRVSLERVEDLGTGRFLVRSGVSAAEAPPSPAARPVSPRQEQPPGENDGTALLSAPRALTVTFPGGTRRTIPLRGGVTTIGRSPECDVRLDDTGASRRHAEIRLEGNRATITDLGSTNGTTVNGQPVTSRELLDGDRLLIGSSTLVFGPDLP